MENAFNSIKINKYLKKMLIALLIKFMMKYSKNKEEIKEIHYKKNIYKKIKYQPKIN